MNTEPRIEKYNIEIADEWSKWIKETPFISFDPEWQVQVIPPYGGAVARFCVKKGDFKVSVYLDCYSRLGYHKGPYWEVYPYRDDVGRCDMSDVKSLLDMIRESFRESNSLDTPPK